MTEAEDARERRVKAMRHNERPLALFWALLASVIVVLALVGPLRPTLRDPFVLGFPSVLAFLVLLAWVSWAIAWRWEGVAAALLALQSFIIIGTTSIVTISMLSDARASEVADEAAVCGAVLSVPICAGGILMASLPSLLTIRFARIWRKSRTSGSTEASESERTRRSLKNDSQI